MRVVNLGLTCVRCQPRVDACGLRTQRSGAGIAEADILHAYANAVRLVEVEQYGEDRLIVIGPDRAGN